MTWTCEDLEAQGFPFGGTAAEKGDWMSNQPIIPAVTINGVPVKDSPMLTPKEFYAEMVALKTGGAAKGRTK